MDTINTIMQTLHQTIANAGCGFLEEPIEGGKNIYYSLRNLMLKQSGGSLTLIGTYDIRAFLSLYRQTANSILQRTLFDAAIPCCYCIDDKCTTLLMAQSRTIEYDGQTKKLCGPYRHWLVIPVTAENAKACVQIIQMMLEHTHSYMHMEAPQNNAVTYDVKEKDSFYIAGYIHKHTILSDSDEAFMGKTLASHGDELRKICADGCRFVGMTANFRNGSAYDFLFGVLLPHKPAVLPGNMVCRKINGGAWAVYNSSAGNYPSVWQHFTEKFYDQQHMGYDDSRFPFEFYSPSGAFMDVHIPVDADLPRENGQIRSIVHMPDMTLMGYRCYAETDHPLYVEHPFDEAREIAHRFPHAAYSLRVSIHAHFGKPLMGFEGVPYDELMKIPEGMEMYTLKGGYEKRVGFKHFCGDVQAWGEALDMPVDSPLPVRGLHHPRGFNQYVYRARGGYSEIGVPTRLYGERIFELVSLPERSIFGKKEAPPESVVTDADKSWFYGFPGNVEPGSYWVAFSQTHIKTESGGDGVYYDKPLIFGIESALGTSAPDGFAAYALRGGVYVRMAEDLLNGEMGWEDGYDESEALSALHKRRDDSRPYLYKQRAWGKKFELYIPVVECPESIGS